MNNPASLQSPEIPWIRIFLLGVAGLLVSTVGWTLISAYTGIFAILNLRVFVGVITVLPALMLPLYGFWPGNITGGETRKVPPSVSLVLALFAIITILAGEVGAGLLRGAPIVWGKFNIFCMLAYLVLPFQINKIFKI